VRGRQARAWRTDLVELGGPAVPVARAAEVRAADFARLEPRARRVPLGVGGVQHAPFLEGVVDLAHERSQRRHMSPRARAGRGREEDAERGEPEAAVAVLGRRAAAEDADAAVGALGEVDDVLRDEVQAARQAVVLEVAQVAVCARLERPVEHVSLRRMEGRMEYRDCSIVSARSLSFTTEMNNDLDPGVACAWCPCRT
jgi:hypothetical protein